MGNVFLSQIMEKMKLENLTPWVDAEQVLITEGDVNRPALQLAGYFGHFDSARVQVIGNVEHSYMQTFDSETKLQKYRELLSWNIPCIVYCQGLRPDAEMMACARETETPLLSSEKRTCAFVAEIIRWMNVKMAPCITIHGVLVDVYGEGLLIMGESGIGKSEAALELIRRGHRLVTDDVVEIRKISDDTLIGRSPEITKHLIELRGIGIIDVKTLFGVECVKETQSIDLVIKLEDWKKDGNYDRLGMEEQYTEFLGTKVVCQYLPIRPGRNLAVICETAAVNHRQKKMGYNAAKELYRRVQNLNSGE